MESIAQAAQAAHRNLANSPQSSRSDKPADSTNLTVLWSKMTQVYGHKWLSSYGPKPTDSWKAILGLSREELSAGLAACLKSGDEWPPSLPQFMAMCKPPKRENAAMYSTQPRLPAPVSAPEVARAYLDTMKANLRATLAAAAAAKPKLPTHVEGIDDYAWFASRPSAWDAEAPVRNSGIVA